MISSQISRKQQVSHFTKMNVWQHICLQQIIGPDNPTCSQFPPDTEFRLNAKKDKGKGEDAAKERVGKGI